MTGTYGETPLSHTDRSLLVCVVSRNPFQSMTGPDTARDTERAPSPPRSIDIDRQPYDLARPRETRPSSGRNSPCCRNRKRWAFDRRYRGCFTEPGRPREGVPAKSKSDGICTRMPLSASPCEQVGCAIQIRPLQHISSAIATPNKSPRRMSMLTAFGSARTNGLPLELCGPTSHLSFLLRRRSDTPWAM